MTSHELAKKLLEGPDLPVVIWNRNSFDEIAVVAKPVKSEYYDERTRAQEAETIELRP